MTNTTIKILLYIPHERLNWLDLGKHVKVLMIFITKDVQLQQ